MRNSLFSILLVILSFFIIKEAFDIKEYNKPTLLDHPVVINKDPLSSKKDKDVNISVKEELLSAPPNLIKETKAIENVVSVEKTEYISNPVLESEISKERADLLSQVRPDSLVSCQTEVVNCEPKGSAGGQGTDLIQNQIFCVTYAKHCLDEKTIGRIYSQEEIFPQETNPNEGYFENDVDYDSYAKDPETLQEKEVDLPNNPGLTNQGSEPQPNDQYNYDEY